MQCQRRCLHPQHPSDLDKRVAARSRLECESDLAGVSAVSRSCSKAVRRGERLVEQYILVGAKEGTTAAVLLHKTVLRQRLGLDGRHERFRGMPVTNILRLLSHGVVVRR